MAIGWRLATRVLVWARAVVVAALFVMGFVSCGSSVVAAGDWTQALLLSSDEASYAEYGNISSCSGGLIEMVHNRSDDRDYIACVFGGRDGTRIAKYISPQASYAYAVSLPGDDDFYKLESACDGSAVCAYSQAADALMAPTYGSSWQHGMGIYKNLRSHLKKKVNLSPLYVYYRLEFDDVPFEVTINGAPAAIESGAFAVRGMWAVLEARSYGVFLVNLETFQVRRVKAPGVEYGLGYDPAYEMAVSDNGNMLAITGMRAGIELYAIDPLCGDGTAGAMAKSFYPLATPCRSVGVDVYGMFPSLYAGHFPSFSADGLRVRLMVQLRDGTVRRAVMGPTVTRAGPDYIALGDSYSSGEGELDDSRYAPHTNTPPHTCHVGVRSYPFLLAQAWQMTLKSVACSGAQTHDISGRGEYSGQEDRIADETPQNTRRLIEAAVGTFRQGIVRQVAFIEEYLPRFITVGIGGNDAGLMGKLQTCLGVGTCEWASSDAMRAASAKEIASIASSVASTITDIQRTSPSATILLIGYPEIINDQERCDGVVGRLLNQDERVFMNESIRYLNRVLASVAKRMSITFVDTQTTFYGNRLCEGQHAAMNGVRYGDDISLIGDSALLKLIGAESFHPTPFGHTLIASRILAACGDSIPVCEAPSFTTGGVLPLSSEPLSYWEVSAGVKVPRLIKAREPTEWYGPHRAVRVTIPETALAVGAPYTVRVDGGVPIMAGVVPDEGLGIVELVPDVEPGYHSLHVSGANDSGEQVDVYRIIGIESAHPPEAARHLGGANQTEAQVSVGLETVLEKGGVDSGRALSSLLSGSNPTFSAPSSLGVYLKSAPSEVANARGKETSHYDLLTTVYIGGSLMFVIVVGAVIVLVRRRGVP